VIQLDATVVNVALPSIGRSLGGSLARLQWVVDAYTLALAGFMLTAGAVADRLGARRVFLFGMALFTVGSAACAAAPDPAVLVAARALQGLGAAALLPCSLALIVHEYPGRRERSLALGTWGAMGSAGMAVGPALGGVLIATVGWRSIFLINVPVGLVELWLVRRFVSESPQRPAERLDAWGLVLSVLALGTLAGGCIEAGELGWTSPAPLALLLGGIVLGVAFVRTEGRRRTPMVPLALFRSRPFSAAVGIGWCFNLSLYGALLCLSLFLQQSRGESALRTGLLLLPMAFVVALGSVISGRMTGRLGHRLPMLCGLLLSAAGAAILATVGPHTSILILVVGTLPLGLCAIAMPAMSSLAVSSAPSDRAGLASGVFNTARQAGGALGVALLGSLLASGSASGASQHHALSLTRPLMVTCALLVAAAGMAWAGTRQEARAGIS
jgi:DHA2 family methylenomycin A resistance protein-like MFS transporter